MIRHADTIVLQPFTKFTGCKCAYEIPYLHWNCKYDDLMYSKAVRSLWGGPDKLIIQEHDVDFPSDRADELVNCSYPYCTVPYLLYPVTTGLDEPVYSIRNDYFDADGNEVLFSWADKGEEFVNFSALGLVKLGAQRKSLSPPPLTHWASLDVCVNHLLRESGQFMMYSYSPIWHVHWPATQHHHQ